MPLPLTVTCFNKIQIGFTDLPFWYRLTWVVPEKGPLNGGVCVCVCASVNNWKNRIMSARVSFYNSLSLGLLVVSIRLYVFYQNDYTRIIK